MAQRIALFMLALTLAGCGGDNGRENTITFHGTDGHKVEMPAETYVWCGPWDPLNSAEPALHVYVGRVDNGRRISPLWSLDATLHGTPRGRPARLPTLVEEDPRPQGVTLFAAWGTNQENSSQEEDSHGRLVVNELRCGQAGSVAFSVDATLGSEYHDGSPIRVRGRFVSPLTDPPAFAK